MVKIIARPGDVIEVGTDGPYPYPSLDLASIFLGMPTGPVIRATGEWGRAVKQHPQGFRSAHEGFAILKEEVDELWAEVIRHDRDPAALKKEAIQVAAMALRFLSDVCGV